MLIASSRFLKNTLFSSFIVLAEPQLVLWKTREFEFPMYSAELFGFAALCSNDPVLTSSAAMILGIADGELS